MIIDKDTIECTPEQSSQRLEICKRCEKFVIDGTTKCSECECHINLMITYTFKQCPLEKW
jgi:hypothetical protein